MRAHTIATKVSTIVSGGILALVTAAALAAASRPLRVMMAEHREPAGGPIRHHG